MKFEQEINHDDITILNSEIEYDKKRNLKYLLYEMLAKDSNGEPIKMYKALKFIRTIRLPKSVKQETNFMDKHSQIISGYWETGINFVTVIANILYPKPIGLLYCYGVQGVASSIEEAKRIADIDFEALQRGLQGSYRTLEYRDLNSEEIEWLRAKINASKNLSILRGVPASRKNPGEAGSGLGGKDNNPDTQETTEEIVAGLSDREYVIMMISTPIPERVLNDWLTVCSKANTNWQSQMQGTSGINFGINIPMMFAGNLGASQGWGEGTSDSENYGESLSHSDSTSFSESFGDSTSNSFSTSDGWSTGENAGANQSFSDGVSTSDSYSDGVSASESYGTGTSHGLSYGESQTQSHSIGSSESTSHTDGTSTNYSTGGGTSSSAGTSNSNSYNSGHSSNSSNGSGLSFSDSNGYSYSSNAGNSSGFNAGVNVGVDIGGSSNATWGESWGESSSSSSGNSYNHSYGTGYNYGYGDSKGTSTSSGTSTSYSYGTGTSSSYSHGYTTSNTDSYGTSTSRTTSDGTSTSHSLSNGTSSSHSLGTGTSATASNGTSTGTSAGLSGSSSSSVGTGTSHSISNGTGTSDGTGVSWGNSRGTSTSLSRALSSGTSASMGVGASIGISKSYQFIDVEVRNIVMIYEQLTQRLNDALAGNGAFYVDLYIATLDKPTQAAAVTLAKSAWQNETALFCPLQVIDLEGEELKHMLYHFAAFSSCSTREGLKGSIQGYKYTTILLANELTAYTHPIRLSEGGQYADIENIPVLSIPSNLDGEIYLGKILSGERWTKEDGYKTKFDYRVSGEENMHHIFFSGESRSGKTVCATRFVVETALKTKRFGKRMRIVVLDPKRDWRVLAKFVEADRFRFYSLGEPSMMPIRFNLLKIPQNVRPQLYADTIIECYCKAYQLGEKVKPILRDAIYTAYDEAGCFNEHWKENAPDLSREVYFKKIYVSIKEKMMRLKAERATPSILEAYERLLDRLDFFSKDYTIESQMFGQGGNALGVDEILGDDDVVVIESAGLDTTFKSFVFAAITGGIWNYCSGFEEGFKTEGQYSTLLVIEEANEVLIGSNSKEDNTPSLFEKMIDQSAGYELFICAITQKIADMPSSIIANTGLAFSLKISREEDKDVFMNKIGKDSRIDDKPLLKFLPVMPIGWCIGKSGRAFDYKETQPVLFQVDRLDLDPPTNAELKEIMKKREILMEFKKNEETK